MQLLQGVARNYSWGSRSLIPELMGEEPADSPVAEVWFGAHPNDPSLIDGERLDDVIARDPQKALGERVIAAFPHERLPYLVKLLAAAEPLSLQAHPTMQQAKEGFARENAAGIPVTDKERNYKDSSHKPEIIIALTDFYAMAGFRPVARTRRLLDALDCAPLARYEAMLESGEVKGDGNAGEEQVSPAATEDSGLRALFTTWITIPAAARKELVEAVADSARAIVSAAESSDGDALPAGVESWMVNDLRTVLELNDRYPGDAGVLGALLLNHIRLDPGQAIYLDAGQLHAYVRGMGVEVMANSDNVLRGGLTPKYVDVPELVKVLTFVASEDPRVTPSLEGSNPQVWHYPVPVEEFSVARVRSSEEQSKYAVPAGAPTIVLCVAGEAELSVDGPQSHLTLAPGQAAWIAAGDPSVTVEGRAEFFVIHG